VVRHPQRRRVLIEPRLVIFEYDGAMTEPKDDPPYVGTHPGEKHQRKPFPVWLIVALGFLSFVVLLVGTLAALAIHGYTRFLRAAKLAEAKNGVGRIAKDAAVAYDQEKVDPSGRYYQALCASASSPIPKDIIDVRGKKYLSAPSEWQADKPTDAGFACLGFSMNSPQYYQFDYRATGSPTLDRFQAIAHGDLDADGVSSSFIIEGRVGPGNALVISPALIETDPEE
jgi:type IV pilus assembly protein PilA